MNPEIGSIVFYKQLGEGNLPTEIQSPALVQGIAEDGTLRLFVFGPKKQRGITGVKQGKELHQWSKEKDEPLAEKKQRVVKK